MEPTPRRLSPDEYLVHEGDAQPLIPDFELLDAWSIPIAGREGDFPRLLRAFVAADPAGGGGLTGALFAARAWLGRPFRLSEDLLTLPIPGCAETTIRERVPSHLSAGPDVAQRPPLSPVIRTDREYLAEYSNRLLHATVHLAWVPADDAIRYTGLLAVHVKYRGRLGRAYITTIGPFRRFIVYPAVLSRIVRMWDDDATQPATDSTTELS